MKVPLTLRVPFGGAIGSVEHHSESPEAYFAHTAGLRVVSPSNPQDAYSMIRMAIESDDPVHLLRAEAPLLDEGRGRSRARRAAARQGAASRGSARMSRSSRTGRWSPPRSMPRRLPPTRASRSRSSTCARSRRSTSTPSRIRSTRPAGVVITHEAAQFGGLGAEIAARRSRIAASTALRPRRSGSPGSTRRIRPRSSRSTSFPTSTACSTRSTVSSAARTR